LYLAHRVRAVSLGVFLTLALVLLDVHRFVIQGKAKIMLEISSHSPALLVIEIANCAEVETTKDHFTIYLLETNYWQ
jgi:hypothetical protein